MSDVDLGRRRLFGLRAETSDVAAPSRAGINPLIDAHLCNACDACLNVCEPGALDVDDAVPAYVINAAACNGCGLCIDVCDRNALALEMGPLAPTWRLMLREETCSVCGKPFRSSVAPVASVCRFCARPAAARGVLRVQE